VGIIVGIDRFMSEARAGTDPAGNAIATVLVGTWTDEVDRDQLEGALCGDLPFDEATMLDDDGRGPFQRGRPGGRGDQRGRRTAGRRSATRELAETPPR
jgi:aerobic C4-dicarboxylate transport protein